MDDLRRPWPFAHGHRPLDDDDDGGEIVQQHAAEPAGAEARDLEKLGISDSTVRIHLRSMNRKRAVGSRMQAVTAARRLGLLR